MAERGYLSIGEVLSLLKPEFADLTISKIRFLESQGLLDPERTPSGYRKFYEPDIDRLRWILRQQHENYLPLKVIKGKLGTDSESEPTLLGVELAVEAEAANGERGTRPVGRGGGATAAAAVRSISRPELGGPPSGVSLTLEELAVATGLSSEDLADLVRFGLMVGKPVAGSVYYDEEALTVANLAAGFMRYGVEARHLRMYRTSAEREAGFFEQVVMPMLKQRNPQARRQAVEALRELSQLG
ncbi:MAG TPA: MerR family transcriptional regulator, partial [Acidimicrobiales bacterium]|nr:MerR family transcriptional regulator [Acidimicrobiales bacterium]